MLVLGLFCEVIKNVLLSLYTLLLKDFRKFTKDIDFEKRYN